MGLVQVAQVPDDRWTHSDGIIKSHDHQLNDIDGLRCSAWTFMV